MLMYRFMLSVSLAAFVCHSFNFAPAQTISTMRRMTAAADDSRLVALKRNTHPLARPEFDQGAVSPALQINRMQLVLTRSAQQESELHALLDAQQDQSSQS